MFDVLDRGVEQVKGDPLGALRADAGQLPEGIDEVLDRSFVQSDYS
ncbi:Uncharacterised protein [Mycobacteroides abscessus subsp. abscessus]|nr:Uncharacterised protein [Mycobacteroides abscessus subsp. abscessus]